MAVSYVSRKEFHDAIKQGNVNGLRDMFTNGRVAKTELYVSLFVFISSMLAFLTHKCLSFVFTVQSNLFFVCFC